MNFLCIFLLDCLLMLLMLLNLLFDIFCYNYDICILFICCMEIVKLNNRLIEVFVNFNECVNFLIVIIERILKIVYLYDFFYGMLFN